MSVRSKDVVPLILWLILFTAIIVLAYVRLGLTQGVSESYPRGLDTVFIGLYLVWMLFELPISRRDVNTEGMLVSDSVACLVYASGQALTILSALWLPSVWHELNIAHFLGIIVFLFGVCYRVWAIRALGRFYSHRVRTVDDQEIVASGPYRFSRHPAYAGMLVANAGICIYFLNYATALIFLLVLFPSILVRISKEEKMLFTIEGYRQFAEPRKRLFPVVW